MNQIVKDKLKDMVYLGKTFQDYATHAMLRRGTAIGDYWRGPRTSPPPRTRSLFQDISNPGRIIAFRNCLIHGYASIADEVVWGILEANLPTLQK